jgi:hypothetical protein
VVIDVLEQHIASVFTLCLLLIEEYISAVVVLKCDCMQSLDTQYYHFEGLRSIFLVDEIFLTHLPNLYLLSCKLA